MLASTSAPSLSLSIDTDSISAIDYLQHLHQFLSLQKRGDCKVSARAIVPIYWRKLIEVGVPIDAANRIAWTIVRYEVAQIAPDRQQQQLLRQYCRFICRAELWRSNLLG